MRLVKGPWVASSGNPFQLAQATKWVLLEGFGVSSENLRRGRTREWNHDPGSWQEPCLLVLSFQSLGLSSQLAFLYLFHTLLCLRLGFSFVFICVPVGQTLLHQLTLWSFQVKCYPKPHQQPGDPIPNARERKSNQLAWDRNPPCCSFHQ